MKMREVEPGMRVSTCYGPASVCDVDRAHGMAQVSLWHQGRVFWTYVSGMWEMIR